ncbi:MAG: 1-acyl-sn-glycerol-3-phosphate acyltransferase [Planctomycetales bacterium]|nr:1-acyl-sn-glycerol-3-phosphate acyltransferase [Planctomycetales bacterium]
MSSRPSVSRPWWKRVGYGYLWLLSRVIGVSWFGLRTSGAALFPRQCGALVCSNHQSHFDPVLVGLVLPERLNYVARKTLFKFFLFRWLIEYLDAIPIDRDGMGLGGIKETLKRLGRSESVLIFPEGTRTADGEIGRLRPGFYAIARRSGKPIVPVAIDGAYQAWPKGQPLPGLSRIAICVGEPITAEQIAEFNESSLLSELDQRLRELHHRARFLTGKRQTRLANNDAAPPRGE